MNAQYAALRLLPIDPQRETANSGQLEVVHLVHVVVHWLSIPVAAVLAMWLAALILAVLGWAGWGLFWLLQRAATALGRVTPGR